MSHIGSIPRIHKLSARLANQISAGEVIERPVSVVKELLENALDASAGEIIIDIEGAGSDLIKMRDNGQGIHPDDLSLALDRHATSKLNTIDDLGRIASLGFRGEALPSIASVSRFSLVSRTAEHDQAWMIATDATDKAPASHPKGTTVEVRDLFYNVPARRKFLKSDKTELLHIQALLKAMALSRFDTAFKLRNHGTPVQSYIPVHGNIEQRIADVLGRKLLDNSLPIDKTFEAMRLWGWIAKPDAARSQTDRQFFYLNGRMIRDKSIIHAIRMAYQDRIYPGRFPCYILYMDMDPSMVDVNVHPAKHEVRFRNLREVHDLVFGVLTEALDHCRLFDAAPPTGGRKETMPYDPRRYSGGAPNPAGSPDTPRPDWIESTRLRDAGSRYAPLNVMNLHEDRYLLWQRQENTVLIDVFAARETVVAFHLSRTMRAEGAAIRTLLVPVSVILPEDKLDFTVHHKDTLKLLGFDLEQISPDTINLRGFPALLPYADLIPLLTQVIDALMAEKNLDLTPQTSEKIGRLMARHVNNAIHPRIDDQEIKTLLRDMERVERAAQNKQTFPWVRLQPSVWAELLEDR